MANAQETTHNQTHYFYLTENETLSGAENIHIIDAAGDKHTNVIVITNAAAVTNTNQIYVIEGTYTNLTSFASITEKVLTVADTKNSKATRKIAPNHTTTKPTTVQSNAQCQATPIFPFLPIKFFSIEQSLSISSSPTYPIPTNKAVVSSAYLIHHTSEKLLKASLAYNSQQAVASISEQFCTYTFSLPPPFLG